MAPRVLVVVLDGVGMRASKFGNAVALAKTPALDRLKAGKMFTTLRAHGTAVGLPSDDDIGNSEVGHNAIGAGRVFAQGAKLVQQAIASGAIFEGATWKELNAATRGTMHFLGLLSDGNVHAHQDHLHALIRGAKAAGQKRVRIHVLLDGRDVGEKTAEVYVERLMTVLADVRGPDFDVEVASGGGRMQITMDRYNAEWEMVHRGWKVHVRGEGPQFPSLSAALAHYRMDPVLTDQNLPGFVIAKNGKPLGPIEDGDSVVFFNFRGDRAIEISRAFTEERFDAFARGPRPKVFYAGMMEYDGDAHIPPKYLVQPPAIDDTLTEYLCAQGIRQFACSETQKFGHVTYFWNGNRSGYINAQLEEYVEIPSDPTDVFVTRPAMKAREITDVTVDRMRRGTFDFGRINYANGDMVGHTGDLNAAIKAMEAVDAEVARLLVAAEQTGTTLLITADHGNADEMYDAKEKDFPGWENGFKDKRPKPKTAHTLAPVPCAIIGPATKGFRLADKEPKSLANIAATVIDLLGLPKKKEYLPSLLEPI